MGVVDVDLRAPAGVLVRSHLSLIRAAGKITHIFSTMTKRLKKWVGKKIKMEEEKIGKKIIEREKVKRKKIEKK